MFESAAAYIDRCHFLPELKSIIQELLIYEKQQASSLKHWKIIPRLQMVFGDQTDILHPFSEAWAMMCACASHLDHLQDEDPDLLLERWNMSPSLLYTALIGGLYASQAILNTLP